MKHCSNHVHSFVTFRKAQFWDQHYYQFFFGNFPEILTNCEVIQFADDTDIFVSAKYIDSIEFILNEDLKNIYSYFVENELVTNLKAGKTKCMFLGTSRKPLTLTSQLKLFYNYVQIRVAESYKYLDTIINSPLNLVLHFHESYKQMSAKLKLFRKSKQCLNGAATIGTFISFMQSSIKYNSFTNLNFTKTLKNWTCWTDEQKVIW